MRDLIWSVGVCALLTLFVQCRPSWSAQRFMERESRAGFDQAFAGRRFATGEIVTPGGGTQHVDPMAPAVVFYQLSIEAQELNWNGDRAEFVVRHVIQLEGSDLTQDIHVRLEKRDARWIYTSFEVRGRTPLAAPNDGNPWARALQPEKES